MARECVGPAVPTAGQEEQEREKQFDLKPLGVESSTGMRKRKLGWNPTLKEASRCYQG